MTEAEMTRLLDKRYGQTVGNGPRYAVAPGVRNRAGFEATRTMDYFAMDLWPSKGLQMIGHEIKCSRSDWLAELKQPEKAEAFKKYMNRWYLVVSDRAIVKPGELPEGWGLIGPRGDDLVVVKSAPALVALPMPKTMMACLLRSTMMYARTMYYQKGWTEGREDRITYGRVVL